MKSLLSFGVLVLLMLVMGPSPLAAQATQKSASDFYLEYRAAFLKAKTAEEVMPYMAARNRQQFEKTPPEARPKMFAMMKAALGGLTDVKVVEEETTEEGVTLSVEAIGAGKKKTTGTVELVKEAGAWKIAKESWGA